MIAPELLKKIKTLEIHTRRMLSGSLVGDSRSALKGTGFEFDQIREYQYGDDTRFIDWKSSSRSNKLLIKQYREERSRSIIIAVDVSASASFSSTDILRAEFMATIASMLSLVANYGSDRVGLLLFSDVVELYIPLNKGNAHVRTLMNTLFTHRSKREKTSIACALDYCALLPLKDGIVFLISDFIDDTFEKRLHSVAKRHDLIALRCLDKYEQSLPSGAFITLQDPETNEYCVIDARAVNNGATGYLKERIALQNGIFKKNGIDCLDIVVGGPFIKELVGFFRRRMMY